MLIYCTADAEKDADMKRLKSEEAITILKDMMVDIPVPKAAVTQIERNEAIEMAINALKCSEILNSSDTISRQAAIDALMEILDRPNHAEFLYTDEICKALKALPSAQPNVHPDGTLIINVPDLDTVHRVLVSSGKRCKVFYLDEE